MASSATRMSVTVRVKPAGVERLMGNPSSPVNAFLLRLGSRVLNNARTKVNVDTGYLRSTGTTELMQGGGVRVAFRAKYALWVHNGNGRYGGNPYLTDALTEELRKL